VDAREDILPMNDQVVRERKSIFLPGRHSCARASQCNRIVGVTAMWRALEEELRRRNLYL